MFAWLGRLLRSKQPSLSTLVDPAHLNIVGVIETDAVHVSPLTGKSAALLEARRARRIANAATRARAGGSRDGGAWELEH